MSKPAKPGAAPSVELPSDIPVKPRFRTRRAAVEYIREVHGIPVTISRMARDSMTAGGRKPIMPPPDAHFGNRFLYSDATLDAYAEILLGEQASEGRAARERMINARTGSGSSAQGRTRYGNTYDSDLEGDIRAAIRELRGA